MKEEIHVRLLESEVIVEISLVLDGTLHQLNRAKEEVIGKALTRLQRTLEKKRRKQQHKQGKKEKKQRQQKRSEPSHEDNLPPAPPTEFEVQLFGLDNKAIDLETPNLTHCNGWEEGQTLIVDGTPFKVHVNPPRVSDLRIAAKNALMVGYPICLEIESEFADEISYTWYRGVQPQFKDSMQEVASGPAYTPTPEDVGKHLLVSCYPMKKGKRGRIVESEVVGPIAEEVIPALEVLRSSCVQEAGAQPDCLRVVCYNILADPYATTEFCRTVLYPYVQPEHLELDYRIQLCTRELVSYKADLICLQECDKKAFDKLLQPTLARHGFGGVYKGKCGKAPEGCATFFQRSKYDLHMCCDINLCDQYDTLPEISELLELVPRVKKVLCEKITTIAQITVLRPVQNHDTRLICVNTHLFFHPDAPCLRLIQGYTILKKATELKQQLVSEGLKANVIICGDMNSTNTRGAALVQLFETGSVPSDHPTWQKLQDFQWGKRGACFTEEGVVDEIIGGSGKEEEVVILENQEEETKNMESDGIDESGTENNRPSETKSMMMVDIDESKIPLLSHELPLLNACRHVSFTNCSSSFKDVLDYIFIENTFEVTQLFPMPSDELVHENVALPSTKFPSDHISLVVDLKEKTSNCIK